MRINFKSKKVYVIFGIAAFPFVFGLFLFALVRFEALGSLPDKKELRKVQNPQKSVILDIRDEVVGQYYRENRTDIELSQVDSFFIDALISTEDRRFYTHGGVDYYGLMRVLIKTILLQKDGSGGGSTITQQLCKNLYPRQSYKMFGAPINKMREMIIAKRLEKLYSKSELLNLYINTVPFGERAFGIVSATDRFFSKEVKDLKPEECALLVGMLKAPTAYSPRRFPERASKRRNVVLNQMKKYAQQSYSHLDSLKNLPLKIDYNPPSKITRQAPYYRLAVKKEFESLKLLKEDGSPYDLNADGLKIKTTLDLDLQSMAENALTSQLSRLQKQFDESWKNTKEFSTSNPAIKRRIKQTAAYKKLKTAGLKESDILDSLQQSKFVRNIWSWEGIKEKELSIIDSIIHYTKILQSGMLSMDPENGAIRTWVGGNNYNYFQLDNILAKRQVGSTFKPLVYATALEKGISSCRYYPNELRTYVDYKDWTPKNANNSYDGYYSLAGALAHSVNTVSVQLILDIGPEAVVAKTEALQLDARIPEVPSIVLGTADISLIEMVKIYASFANGGYLVEPYTIEEVSTIDGTILYTRSEKDFVEVWPSFVADTILTMLEQVSVKGTGRRLHSQYNIPMKVAGKTGTTQRQTDGWFMACTPDLVIGSWVGTTDRRIHFRDLATGSGSNTALPICGSFLEKVARSKNHHSYREATYYFRDNDLTASEYLCPLYKESLIEEPVFFNADSLSFFTKLKDLLPFRSKDKESIEENKDGEKRKVRVRKKSNKQKRKERRERRKKIKERKKRRNI